MYSPLPALNERRFAICLHARQALQVVPAAPSYKLVDSEILYHRASHMWAVLIILTVVGVEL